MKLIHKFKHLELYHFTEDDLKVLPQDTKEYHLYDDDKLTYYQGNSEEIKSKFNELVDEINQKSR